MLLSTKFVRRVDRCEGSRLVAFFILQAGAMCMALLMAKMTLGFVEFAVVLMMI